MGLKYAGVPKTLVEEFLNHFTVKYFVETGTYLGETAAWASQRFEKVFTIEKSFDLWNSNRKKFEHMGNIDFLFGDSREQLHEITAQLESTTMFWLDAHWSGGNTYGKNDECALLDELRAINEMQQDKFILVDDARLFMFPPPHPYSPVYWPNISDVLELLDRSIYYTVIVDDVIVAIPVYAKQTMLELYQDYSTQSWEAHLKNFQASRNQGVLKLLKDAYLNTHRLIKFF